MFLHAQRRSKLSNLNGFKKYFHNNTTVGFINIKVLNLKLANLTIKTFPDNEEVNIVPSLSTDDFCFLTFSLNVIEKGSYIFEFHDGFDLFSGKDNKLVFKSIVHVKNKHKDITAENNTQYNAVKHANEVLESGLNKRADKHEEDRIGQGNLVGKNLGIGGLNKAERAMKNLQADNKAPQIPIIKPLKGDK